MPHHTYNDNYINEYQNRVAFPLGGIGAGMVCMEGTGALSHLSIRNAPDVYAEPYVFPGICVKGRDRNIARVIEGLVPRHKAFGAPGTGNGAKSRTYGFPRFANASFIAKFPFGIVELGDPKMPVAIELTGWSPFTPGDADSSSLPVAAMEYRIRNVSGGDIDAVFSFNSRNIVEDGRAPGANVTRTDDGFTFHQPGSDEKPWLESHFRVATDAQGAQVNAAWFRGGWFDPQTAAWRWVEEGACFSADPPAAGGASPGASIYVPIKLAPGEERLIRIRMSWYVPLSNIRSPREADACSCAEGECADSIETYRPWYAAKFDGVESIDAEWAASYDELRERSETFASAFYDTTLPPEVVEAVAANLTILKSPTVLRQTDGRLWCWEGCSDSAGCCAGSCTHVWNYAQALPHLFPDLERTLRQTEFNECQSDDGRQLFRAPIPIRPVPPDYHAAADGHLGGIMKVYREWRVSGDTEWLRSIWPRVRRSLDYGIATWDPDEKGALFEPHHNTYDIEFWGPDGMCGSFYIGALKAATAMGQALGDDVSRYETILRRGIEFLENELFNGEYFYQRVMWKGLRAQPPAQSADVDAYMRTGYSADAMALLDKEGPKYQYGEGCLSDGALGCWIAEMCGVGDPLSGDKVASHLEAVHRHNFLPDLSEHSNPQRPSYAFGSEGGLILCSWPRGGKPTQPFVYSNEVWTGIEYQVASHLMLHGMVEKGLQIVRAARDRYDGRFRNPFNEYECGHWYARAMASYGLIQGLTGQRYDAVDKVLYLEPRVKGDFRSFISTATGYGAVGVKDGEPFIEVASGGIDVRRIEYKPATDRYGWESADYTDFTDLEKRQEQQRRNGNGN